MNKNLTTMIGALLALALIASACGGDDASASDQDIIDAVVAQLREDEDAAPEGVDIECMAAAMVSGMGGAEGMEANYGLTTATIAGGQNIDDVELPRDDAITFATDAMECGMGEFILAEMTGDGMPADDAKCLFEKLDQDAVRDMMAAQFMGAAEADAVGEAAEDALTGSMLGALVECDIDPTTLGG